MKNARGKTTRWTPLKCPRAIPPGRSLFLAGFTGGRVRWKISFLFLTEMKSKNAGGGPVNGAKVGRPGGRGTERERGGRRDRHGDVNRNDNDYGRSYRGASFLNDYVLENYCA